MSYPIKSEVVYKICALKNFAKFTAKHLHQILFFKKLQADGCNFIKKETLAQVFPREYSEMFKNIFFTYHLQWLLL